MPGNLFNTFSADPASRGLRKALVAFRVEQAKRLNIEPYKVFPNATLELLLAAHPENLEELAAIKGMGPKKLKQFGEALLATISSGIAEGTVVSYDDAPAKPTTRTKKTASLKQREAREEGEPILAPLPKVVSVSDYLEAVNDALYREQAVIQAEIFECQIHPSGVYFKLKDKNAEAILECYINPRVYASLGVPLESGLEVRVGGFPRIYVPKGRFSFQVLTLELAGEGSLKKAYDLLKKQLEAEGLFMRKRAIPECISRIGVITSRTGAVIGDFRKNLEPLGYSLHLYDARVEGAQAVSGILRALEWFNDNADRFDVLVIIRGGGSLEDMQAFNNERVARAVFASKLPTLAGIGHDRDVPIVSLVADYEGSTPSIVAGAVNQSWMRVRRALALQEQELMHVGELLVQRVNARLDGSTRSLMSAFGRLVTRPAALARDLAGRFMRAYEASMRQLLEYERNLARMNPERNLQLGYSIIRDTQGSVVRSAARLAAGDDITARLGDGSVDARITDTHPDGKRT